MTLLANTQKNVLAGSLVFLAGISWLLAAPTLPAAWLVGLAGLLLGFWAPAWALALMALVAPFEQAHELIIWGTVYTTEVILLAILPGAAWNLLNKRGWLRGAAPVEQWLLPFLAVLLLSTLLAHTPSAHKGLLRWLEFLLALVLGVHVLRRSREAETVIWALTLAGAVSAAWGFFQFWTSDASLPKITLLAGEVVRAAAGYGANTLAVLLAMLLPFALGAALFHPRGLGRLIGLLSAGLMLAGWLAAFSLTGWLALATAGGMGFILLFRHAPQRLFYSAMLLLLLLVLGIVMKPELLSGAFWETKLASGQDRLDYLYVVGKIFQQAPWLGIGAGQYRLIALDWGTPGMNILGLTTYPHALWLSVLAELGLLGLAGLWFAIQRASLWMMQKIKTLPPGWPLIRGYALLAGLAGFLVANLTEHCLIHDRGVHAALALAATMVLIRRPGQRPLTERRQVYNKLWQGEESVNWAQAIQARQWARAPLYTLLHQALAPGCPAKVIELGCGPALDALALARRPELEVHAADFSAAALHQARLAAGTLQRSLQLHQVDIRKTGLPGAEFDLVFSQGVLEHFQDPGPVWEESARLLKPGGYLVVDVPQTYNPYTFIKWWHQWRGDWPWGWETQYSVWELRAWAKAYGLKFITAQGYGYRGGRFDPFAWLQQWGHLHFPGVWKKWEQKTGAWWMMNVVGLFRKV